MKRIFSILITLILIIFIGYTLNQNRGELIALLDIKISIIIFYSVLLLVSFLLNAIFLRMIFNKMGALLSFKQSFAVFSIKRLSNYFLPRSGILTSGVYLKKIYSIGFEKSISYALYLSIVQLLVWSLAALIVVLFIYKNIALVIFFSILMLIALTLIIYPKIFLVIPHQRARQKVEIWIKSFCDFSLIYKSFLIWLLIATLTNIRLYLLFISLGYEVGFAKIIIINSLGMLSAIIAITPAALGIKEAAMGLGAKFVEESAASVILVASVDRILIFLWLLVLGILAFYKINKKQNDQKT